MGIMMPETCWVNLKWTNIFTCVFRWFFLLLNRDNFIFVLLINHNLIPWTIHKPITSFTFLLHLNRSETDGWADMHIQANPPIDRPHITAERIPSRVIRHAVSGKFLLLRNQKVRLCPLKSGQPYHNCRQSTIKNKWHLFRRVNSNGAGRENWKIEFGWPLKCKCACPLS